MTDTGTVVALRRYPVKSMLGEDLGTARFTASGLEGDRVAAVIDVETGNVATAKHPRLWRGLLAFAAQWNGGSPRITLPDGASIGVDDADVPYQVLEIGRGTEGSTFVDFAPVHLITSATLAHVGTEMIRYRPNLVVDLPGSTAFAENDWTGREVSVGPARLRVMLPAPRCAVPTLAHGTLPRRIDAVRTLLVQNRVAIPDAGVQPCLGAYAQVVTGGTVSVGDRASLS